MAEPDLRDRARELGSFAFGPRFDILRHEEGRRPGSAPSGVAGVIGQLKLPRDTKELLSNVHEPAAGSFVDRRTSNESLGKQNAFGLLSPSDPQYRNFYYKHYLTNPRLEPPSMVRVLWF